VKVFESFEKNLVFESFKQTKWLQNWSDREI
jgi:hypothetical protein